MIIFIDWFLLEKWIHYFLNKLFIIFIYTEGESFRLKLRRIKRLKYKAPHKED